MITSLPKAFLSTLAVLSLAVTAFASPQKLQPRLTAPIDNSARATLAGSQPPRARLARDLGAVDGSTPLPSMTLVFSRSAAQQAALSALIAAQQNPASPEYHQWLTPAEFGARFGMADADIDKAEAWLQSQGFDVLSVSPSRDRIAFSGTASTAASAFGVPLHHYALGAETHIAPSADISLPASLSGVVEAVTGLSDFRPRPRVLRSNAVVRPNFTSSQTGNHFLTPLDIGTIYDINPAYNSGNNGTGQSIAVVGQSYILTTDVTNFQTALGQTAKAPTMLLVPNTGIAQAYSGDESESDLDLEYTTGIAPGATIYFVYVGADDTASVFDSLTFAVQNDIAPIINISYGECEPDLGQANYTQLNSVLQQAAAQGQTVVSAAGDDGSTDCYGDGTANSTILAVDFPSSSQYVTGLGGTEFPAADVAASTSTTTYFKGSSTSDIVSSALTYIPEGVWNDDATGVEEPLSAGAGGASIFTQRPTWQTGVPGIVSGATRLVPDIALDASPNNAPYAYCSSDSSAWASGQESSCSSGLRDSATQDLTLAGGTSFAAPIFAGMVAILNQAKGYSSQGVVNPTLYSLASNSSVYASAFHDITSGSNACDLGTLYCSAAGAAYFSATTGYDEASGLGSVDFYNLLTAWPASSTPGGPGTGTTPGFTVTATAISVTSGSTATSTLTITPVNGYTGTIAWTVLPSASISEACYSLPNTTVSGTGTTTATLTITTGTTTCGSGTSLSRTGTSATATLHRPSSPARPSAPAAPITLAAFGLAAVVFAGRRRYRRLPALLAIVLLAGVGLGLSGCGGSSTGVIPPPPIGPTTTDYTLTLLGKDTANSAITAKTTLTFTFTIPAN